MAATPVARRTRNTKDHRAEADAWVEGAREQFEALIEMTRRAPPGEETERAVMKGLAVVGAALLHSLSSRRGAQSTTGRRARSPRRRTRSA